MKVNLFFSKKDLYINFDKKTDMIIVTGMSGSGKSELAISLKEKYGYEIISFDMIFDYDENRELSLIEKDILTKFRSCYPKYKVAHLIENDENICDCFYNFVKKYIKKEKIKIIFDGSYFMERVNFELFKNERIVYKRTSFLKALFRRDVRNISRIKNKNYSFIRFIKEIYWHYRYNIKHLKVWYKAETSFLQKVDDLYVQERRQIVAKEIDLKEQRKLQVKGLSYIKTICDENEIPYFLANGTLLGAVKYNGYIPWDDDIDICLKRKDYIKLLEVMGNEKNEEYELLTVYNTKDYYYPYAKLVNKKTRVIENAREIRNLGVYIDIFPIDYFDEDVMEYYHKIRFVRNMSAKRIRIRNNLEKTSFNVKTEKKVHFKFIKNIIYTFVDIISLPLGYNFWAKYLDKLVSKNACGKYAGVIYINPPKVFSASLFDITSEYEFESQMFTSVKDCNCYLSNLYGDYQKDLPENQRRSHHQIKAYWRDDYE